MQGGILDKMIYLDHAATTPLAEEVLEEMKPYFRQEFGNPSTLYSLGLGAAKAIENARGQVAEAIGASPEEIFFTSGGTESDNWAIQGLAIAREKKGREIITSQVEHHAILESCKYMETRGWKVTRLGVDKYGLVDPDELKRNITDHTTLVSIMHSNNEVGTIEPIEELADISHQRNVTFHTDAVQSIGKIPVRVDELKVDALSASAHKFHGPKGVGFLYVRKGTRITPFMHGGGQESKRRAGTHNVSGIVGLGKAIEIAAERVDAESSRLDSLSRLLHDGIEGNIPDIRFNGHPTNRLPGNIHICVEGVEGEAMLLRLSAQGICISSGSACTTGELEASHVLLAMGIPPEVAHGSVRITMGRDNTEADVKKVIEVFPQIIQVLREMSPVYNKK